MAHPHNRSQVPSTKWFSWFQDPFFLLAISLVFAADQVSKALVRNGLVLGESIPRTGQVRITHALNSGGAFGLFPDQTMFLIMASIVGIGILLLVYRNHQFPGSLIRISLGLQLGGAVGNLSDRIRVGEVTDFIAISVWPIFNLADSAIVIGIIMLVYLFFFVERNRNPSESATPDQGYSYDWEGLFDPDVTGIGDCPNLGTEMLCPMCDGVMDQMASGWLCSNCGVTELLRDR